MQKYTLENGHETQQIEMPESWAEVSVAQYRKLLNANSSAYPDIEIVAALSGLSVDWWKEYKDYRFFITIVDSLTFLATQADFGGKPNRKFTFDEKEYELPDDAFFGTVAQYEDMKQIAIKIQEDRETGNSADILEAYSLIARSFLHPFITGKKYDFREVAGLKDEYEERLSIVFVMQVGTFFLKRLTAWRAGMIMYSKVTKRLGFLRKTARLIRQVFRK